MTAVEYMRASKERLDDALVLREQERFALAHYAAGIAVECILRAYRLLDSPEFDARHDLRALTKLARYYERVVPHPRQEEFAGYVQVVTARWSNEQRYLSAGSLLAWLHARAQDRGIEGDVLKESSRRLYNAAYKLVERGVTKWPT